MAVKKVTYKLNLNNLGLDKIENKEAAIREVGEYLKTTILDYVGEARTPIKGGSYKKTLSKSYKKFKGEIASPIPNMELTGNMLDTLTWEPTDSGIEIGIFDEGEAQKADNHNKFSVGSLATDVPARQFIPKNGRDEFRDEIIADIRDILSEYKVTTEEESFVSGLVRSIIRS